MTYRCWGDDGEDLTAKVAAAIRDKGHVTIQTDAAAERTNTNAVRVQCAKGHENVFYVEEH